MIQLYDFGLISLHVVGYPGCIILRMGRTRSKLPLSTGYFIASRLIIAGGLIISARIAVYSMNSIIVGTMNLNLVGLMNRAQRSPWTAL